MQPAQYDAEAIGCGLTDAGTVVTAAEPVSSELRQITAQPSMQQA